MFWAIFDMGNRTHPLYGVNIHEKYILQNTGTQNVICIH